MKAEQEQRPAGEFALWTALLAPPIVWAAGFQTSYAMTSFRCYSGTRLPIFIVTAATLLITAAAGVFAFVNWERVGKVRPNEATGVTSHIAFMSVLALLGSGLFSLLAIAMIIAVVMIHPCWR